MIAIQSEIGDVIWLDAVLSYRRQYSSSISSHPIEDGSSITDHVSQQTPKFSISGIITNADFHTTRPDITSGGAAQNELAGKGSLNSSTAVRDSGGPVIGGGPSPLTKFLPQSISQFVEGEEPSVEVPDNSRRDWVQEVETYLLAVERGHELVTILEFEGNIVKNSMPQCYISSITFSENVETGAALEVDIELERVKFVTLREETVSRSVADSIRNTTETKKNKGTVSVSSSGELEELPKRNEPTEMNPLKGLTKLFSK